MLVGTQFFGGKGDTDLDDLIVQSNTAVPAFQAE